MATKSGTVEGSTQALREWELANDMGYQAGREEEGICEINTGCGCSGHCSDQTSHRLELGWSWRFGWKWGGEGHDEHVGGEGLGRHAERWSDDIAKTFKLVRKSLGTCFSL